MNGEAMSTGVTSEALEVLRGLAAENNGLLDPEDVVREAARTASPLHDYFTWDETEAARRWRLEQAAGLIRRVRVVVQHGPQEPIRAFVSLSTDRRKPASEGQATATGGYRAIESVMSDAQLRAQLLSDALHEMRAFKNKYARLSELREVFAAMSAAIESVKFDKAPA